MTNQERWEEYDRSIDEDMYDNEWEEYKRNKREFEEEHPFNQSDFI